MQRNFILSLLIVFSCINLNAQPAEPGGWLYYFGNQKINSKWNWHNEVQHRNYTLSGELEQLLLRTGLGYTFQSGQNILLGYGFISANNYLSDANEAINVKEHRIYQQYISQERFGRVYLQHRYRFEERFLNDTFKFRYRYFLLAQIPLNHSSIQANTFYLAGYNELFIHHDEGNYFDRNRTALILGFSFTPQLRVEVGAMTQFLPTSSRTQLTIGFVNNLSLKQDS